MTPCPHPPEWLKHFPADGNVQCGKCGHVWVSRSAVQRKNFHVYRQIVQLLGTLVGGCHPPTAGSAQGK